MRILGLLLLVMVSMPSMARADAFVSLCFHDVRTDVGRGDDLSMATDRFVALLSWLRQHDYKPVSIDDLLQAREGKKSLPDKAVLLTFDDGYRGFYTQVYPLLKAHGYPAVLAVVGSWLDAAPGESVDYGGSSVPREKFLSWQQLREMADSGLVEIASHSYNGHRGVLANPQGNTQPALTARVYAPDTQSYEDDAAYVQRVREDLEANARLLEKRLGRRPRVMVWPFGKFSLPGIDAAGQTGMVVDMGLGDGPGDTGRLAGVNRLLVEGSLKLTALTWRIQHLLARDPQRVVQVDLDYVYDPDPQQTDRNLGKLIERIKAMQISTVYLQAFADPDGDGIADALYFPNRTLPVRADLFNRAAWQLKTRAGVKVYAWLPVLGYATAKQDLLVQSWHPENNTLAVDAKAYKRLSPFVPEVREMAKGIYADMARHADFDGLLFHDDALLSVFEDANPAAMAWRKAHGLSSDPVNLWNDDDEVRRWTHLKTEYLVDFTRDLADAVRVYRPEIKTARNLYARAVLDPEGEMRFSQNLESFLKNYDYTALMAMPYLEEAEDAEAWLEGLVTAVKRVPDGLKKTVFELQSVDWRGDKNLVSTKTLSRQMRLLQGRGAVNFGYYPDDFLNDHPAEKPLHPAMSLNSEPFGEQ
jgi:biofilm PGA synthesis lipoprotein PgaB